jgi:uncharacterized ferredoxin-like protein
MPRLTITETNRYLYSPNDVQRRENVVEACKLMANAAFTAPVTGGQAQLEAEIVYGQEEQDAIARKMEELAYQRKTWEHIFLYEAVMAREADAILLLGNTRAHVTPWDGECGACGGDDCGYVYSKKRQKGGLIDDTDRRRTNIVNGPVCAVYAHNLGYAVGAAVITAVRLLVDARPMMSIGLAARDLGYCKNSELVIAVPAAAHGKFEFGEIAGEYHLVNKERGIDAINKQVSQCGLRPAGGAMGIDYRVINPEKKK